MKQIINKKSIKNFMVLLILAGFAASYIDIEASSLMQKLGFGKKKPAGSVERERGLLEHREEQSLFAPDPQRGPLLGAEEKPSLLAKMRGGATNIGTRIGTGFRSAGASVSGAFSAAGTAIQSRLRNIKTFIQNKINPSIETLMANVTKQLENILTQADRTLGTKGYTPEARRELIEQIQTVSTLARATAMNIENAAVWKAQEDARQAQAASARRTQPSGPVEKELRAQESEVF